MAERIRRHDEESPLRELERDPAVGGARDPTNERVADVRDDLRRDPTGTGGEAARAEAHEALVDAGSPTRAALPAEVPPSMRPGEVRPRPPSPQADEGQRHAADAERAPLRVAPEGDTLGIVHIVEALDDLVFPMTRTELLARAGAWRIPVTGRAFRTLAEYMENVREDAFRSPMDVARAIRRARRESQSHFHVGRYHT